MLRYDLTTLLHNFSAIPTTRSANRLAIGNPFGVGKTVTFGIISASPQSPGHHTSRNSPTGARSTPKLLARSSIQRPLIEQHRDLSRDRRRIAWQSFCAPRGTAKKVLEQIIKAGRLTRGWMASGSGHDHRARGFFQAAEIRGALITEDSGTPLIKRTQARDILVQFKQADHRPSSMLNLVAALPRLSVFKVVRSKRKGREGRHRRRPLQQLEKARESSLARAALRELSGDA